MKFKHFAMLFVTLVLAACSNNNTNTNDTERIQSDSIYETPRSVHYGVDVIDDNENISITDEEINEESIETTLLSSFSTKVYTKTDARMTNLNIVCEKLTGVIIAPGEVFSYNETCGPYNKENGFQKATVFINDEEVQDYGGGVCQISSTLYNAVKNCGVEIIERNNHSKDVYYVPRNQDATVSYGLLDFKFKNLNDYSLRINASANKEKVTVEIHKA